MVTEDFDDADAGLCNFCDIVGRLRYLELLYLVVGYILIYRCYGCKTFYCTKECHSRHWPTHGKQCQSGQPAMLFWNDGTKYVSPREKLYSTAAFAEVTVVKKKILEQDVEQVLITTITTESPDLLGKVDKSCAEIQSSLGGVGEEKQLDSSEGQDQVYALSVVQLRDQHKLVGHVLRSLPGLVSQHQTALEVTSLSGQADMLVWHDGTTFVSPERMRSPTDALEEKIVIQKKNIVQDVEKILSTAVRLDIGTNDFLDIMQKVPVDKSSCEHQYHTAGEGDQPGSAEGRDHGCAQIEVSIVFVLSRP